MKQLSLLFLTLCALAFGAAAATVSGTVTYSGSSAPAVGQKVYLIDSSVTGGVLFVYRDSAVTNSSGVYSITVPSTVTGASMLLYTYGCGATWYSGYYTYTGANITANITMYCGSITVTDTVKNSITGSYVFGQKAYIVDSTATVFYKDSAYTNSLGAASFSVPPYIGSGTFKVYTYACGWQMQTFSYFGNPMTAPTLSVCVSNAIISGTVTNVSTSAPVAYYPVRIVDSSATAVLYSDSTNTNASGFYSIALPPTVPSGTMIANTQACGAQIRNSAAYSGGSLTLNLAVCATSSATVSGTVTNATTSSPAAGQKVYLYDSAGTSFVYYDSTTTNTSGGYSFIIPPSIMSGSFSVSTASCGVQQYQYTFYTGSSVVVNHTIYSGPIRTLSGTVYNYSGTPAAGVSVQISSSTGALSVSTSSTGTYSFSLPCSWPTTGTGNWVAYNYSSGMGCYLTQRTFTNSNSNITRIDTLCYYGISGIVSKQGGGAAPNAKVYFISETVDTTTTPNSFYLAAVDSTVTDAAGGYTFAGNFSYGMTHYVKAALQPGDPAYSSFLPTYFDSSLVWSAADSVTYGMWVNNANNVNISLRGGANPGGAAFIGGNVLLGANKSAAVGDPLPGRVLLLTTSSGQAIAYTYSNSAGNFSFPNLSFGSYLLFGDAWGKTNPPLAVTVSQGNGSVSNVIFEENSNSFKGHFGALGTGGPAALQSVRLYPNPVKDYLAFSGLDAIQGAKTVALRNVTGAIISTTQLAAGSISEIPTGVLPAGVYLLQLRTSDGVGNYRFVKE